MEIVQQITSNIREQNPFSEQSKNAQRQNLREYLYDRKPKLSPVELCHVLNYVLALPIVIGKHSVLAQAIPQLVVNSWTARSRKQAEKWIEQQMMQCGMLPKLAVNRGGRPNDPPLELVHWIPGKSKVA